MHAPRIQLAQTIWFLSRPWEHLGGWRELVVRAAFTFEGDFEHPKKRKTIEGCSVVAVPQDVDEAQLAAALDNAETLGTGLPMLEVIPWRAAVEAQVGMDPIPARLLSWAGADAGLRLLGLSMPRGFEWVWPMESSRKPEDPAPEWLTLESNPDAPEIVLPGVSLQQHIALAQAKGEETVLMRGPWGQPITHIPQRESDMMAQMHGDLYLAGADGPSVGGTGICFVEAASVANAVGFGYSQTVETHRRFGIGRLRGN